MANTKNLATVPSVDLSNAANLLAEVDGEIVRLPYSLIDEKLVLKTEFSEYKISNDAELAKQKSDLNELKNSENYVDEDGYLVLGSTTTVDSDGYIHL